MRDVRHHRFNNLCRLSTINEIDASRHVCVMVIHQGINMLCHDFVQRSRNAHRFREYQISLLVGLSGPFKNIHALFQIFAYAGKIARNLSRVLSLWSMVRIFGFTKPKH